MGESVAALAAPPRKKGSRTQLNLVGARLNPCGPRLCAALRSSCSAAADAVFSKGDAVTLYAIKVGSSANPSEVYAFYSLPHCAPDEIVLKLEDLGPLKGDRPTTTNYDIRFQQGVTWRSLCKKEAFRRRGETLRVGQPLSCRGRWKGVFAPRTGQTCSKHALRKSFQPPLLHRGLSASSGTVDISARQVQ